MGLLLLFVCSSEGRFCMYVGLYLGGGSVCGGRGCVVAHYRVPKYLPLHKLSTR